VLKKKSKASIHLVLLNIFPNVLLFLKYSIFLLDFMLLVVHLLLLVKILLNELRFFIALFAVVLIKL